MKHRHTTLIAVALIGILVLAACGPGSDDVPTLRGTGDTQATEATADAADQVRDAEAAMMALTQCLRDQGIEVYDPVVDAEGNVQKPELAKGGDREEKELWAAYESCAEHLEGFTFEKKRVDVSQQVDQWVAVTTCLREKGYDVDDPTAETLDQWGSDFKSLFNFKDPAAMADYEECSGEAAAGKGK
jgi:hypothetical protein